MIGNVLVRSAANKTRKLAKLGDVYIQRLSANRLNTLLEKISRTEYKHRQILEHLKIDPLEKLMANVNDAKYDYELGNYLTMRDGRVEATDDFVAYLHTVSNTQTFGNEKGRNQLNISNIDEVSAHIKFLLSYLWICL